MLLLHTFQRCSALVNMHDNPLPKKKSQSLGGHKALHISVVNVLLVTVSSFFPIPVGKARGGLILSTKRI